ncbi:C-terminal binding protein [Halonotius terrestris]|uniref:C-terminal binding protein n=1 Tax=Halonotius terrestris TaxID=2487750 RepID=A0A8J8PBC8_9EURY|nr:C-terminal binding protein [Halonotius terrestris]TQQ79946.1 C-terminal binding protein [Halonotius terrestris]
MSTVVVNDDPMIRTETLQAALGDDIDVVTATLDSSADIIEAAGDAHALVVDVNTPVPADVFEACEALEIVARAGVGVDGVDIPAAADHGVTVVNVPDYCREEVSTHAVSLLLGSIRRLNVYDRAVKRGEWDWADGQPIHRLTGETVGFLSFGQLARATAEKLAGFDCEIVAADPYVDSEEMADYGVEKVPLDELLETADHVSVHAPLTDETRHLFDREAFGKMSETAVLVNVGRGGIIDEEALVWALENDEIAAAGLDVIEDEPLTDSPLADRDDVILTPHAAFYSEESLAELNEHIATDILAVFDGEEPAGYIDPEADWL